MVHDPFFIPLTFENYHSFASSIRWIDTNVTLRSYEQVQVTFKYCSTWKIKLFNSLASWFPFKGLCSWILSLLSPHELDLRCGSLQPNLSNSLGCSSQPWYRSTRETSKTTGVSHQPFESPAHLYHDVVQQERPRKRLDYRINHLNYLLISTMMSFNKRDLENNWIIALTIWNWTKYL